MKHFLLLLTIIFGLSFNSISQNLSNSHTSNQEQGILPFDTNLKVFPNPVIGNLFQVTSKKEISSITTTNMLGQKTSIKTTKKNPKHYSVSFDKKLSGIYLVTVNYIDKSKEVKRIIAK